jgi:hypothetical protein
MAGSAFGEVERGGSAAFRTVERRGAKIVWNRQALDELTAGMADGLEEVLVGVRDDAAASAPRDPEKAAGRGVPMMADTGRVAVYAAGKLVSGTAERSASGNKPRGARTPADQVVGFVMFDSPISHFAEEGTVKERARPFLLPAFNRGVGGIPPAVLGGMTTRARRAG